MAWIQDIYKLVEAMTPLYFALLVGYGSIRWWSIFSREQAAAANKFVCYFTLPIFTFNFVKSSNPYEWDYQFIGADVVAKALILIVIGLWSRFGSMGSYSWFITSFSLSTLTNALVVGEPLVHAMYGQHAVGLVVQAAIVQTIIWLTILLFALEVRRTQSNDVSRQTNIPEQSSDTIRDVEGNGIDTNNREGNETAMATKPRGISWLQLVKTVFGKMGRNPNSYASLVGLIWALISNKLHFGMPGIIEGCIQILSKAGTGTAMFSMGLFMGQQEKLIACGPRLTLLGMLLRFILGPAAMAIGCFIVGLHGDTLRVAIIQAAIPQSITSFI